MPTSRTPKTPQPSTNSQIPEEEIAYYNRRLQNRVFDEVIQAFAHEAKAGRISRATLAKRIGKKPEQITRYLSNPSNFTLDTISTILIGLGAELDPTVAFLRDKPAINYAPPLIQFLDSVSAVPAQGRQIIDLGALAISTRSDTPNTGKAIAN